MTVEEHHQTARPTGDAGHLARRARPSGSSSPRSSPSSTCSYASPSFLTPGNLFNVFRNFAFVGIIALGMTAVIITGGIDLSVGSVLVPDPAWSPA